MRKLLKICPKIAGFALASPLTLGATFSINTFNTNYNLVANAPAYIVYTVTNTSGGSLKNFSFSPSANMNASFVPSFSSCLANMTGAGPVSAYGATGLSTNGGTCTLYETFTAPGPGTSTLLPVTACASNGSLCNSSPSVSVTSNAHGQAYVTNSAANTVSIIDTYTQTVLTTLSSATLNSCTSPIPAAPSPDGTRMYIGCATSVQIINTSNFSVSSGATALTSSNYGLAVTPDGSRYVVAGDGTGIQVVNSTTNAKTTVTAPGTGNRGVLIPAVAPLFGNYAIIANDTNDAIYEISNLLSGTASIATLQSSIFGAAGVSYMTLTPSQTYYWALFFNSAGATALCFTGLTAASSNPCHVLTNSATMNETSFMALPQPDWNNPYGYVAYANETFITLIDPVSGYRIHDNFGGSNYANITMPGAGQYQMTFTPDGQYLYVANFANGTISIVYTPSNTLATTLTTGTSPYYIAMLP